jgi:hypothetical protein
MTNPNLPADQQTPKHGRAALLLRKLVASGGIELHRLAGVFGADERTLGMYIAGSAPIPLEQQRRFGRFLEVYVPSLARQGRNLLGQIEAEERYRSGATQVHEQGIASFTRKF